MGTRNRIKADALARWILNIVIIALVAVIILLGIKLFRNMMSGDWGGGEIISVPDVAGLDEQTAGEMLKAHGLIARVSQRSYNNDYPMGQIFRQSPAAGAKTKTGRKINIWLSLGPANFVVPDLIGMQYEEAGNKIIESGLVVGKARKIFTTQIPAGQVINQSPDPGEVLTSAVMVDLTVADRAQSLVSVPELVGSMLPQAEELLINRNLHLAQVNYIASDNHPHGTVLGQSLTSGKQVAIGSEIQLDVAIELEVKQSLTKSFTYSIQVPPGPPRQLIKIKVFDDLGSKVVYEEEHPPGYQIDKRLDIEGSATLMVFIGDMIDPYRIDKI